MFIRIQTKMFNGSEHYYASLVENKRVGDKVKQSVKAYLGPVTADQIPYLKAAYAKVKPRLIFEDCEEGGDL